MNKILSRVLLLMVACFGGILFASCNDEPDKSTNIYYTLANTPVGVENVYLSPTQSANNKTYFTAGTKFSVSLSLAEGQEINDLKLVVNETEYEFQYDSTSFCYCINDIEVPSADFNITYSGSTKPCTSNITITFDSFIDNCANFSSYRIKYDISIFGMQTTYPQGTCSLQEFMQVVLNNQAKTIENVEYNDTIEFEIWSESLTLPYSTLTVDTANSGTLYTATIEQKLNTTNGKVKVIVTAKKDNTTCSFNNLSYTLAENHYITYFHEVANDTLFSLAGESSYALGLANYTYSINLNKYADASLTSYYNNMSIKVNDMFLQKANSLSNMQEGEYFIDSDNAKVLVKLAKPYKYFVTEGETEYASLNASNGSSFTFGFYNASNTGQSLLAKMKQDGMVQSLSDSVITSINRDVFVSIAEQTGGSDSRYCGRINNLNGVNEYIFFNGSYNFEIALFGSVNSITINNQTFTNTDIVDATSTGSQATGETIAVELLANGNYLITIPNATQVTSICVDATPTPFTPAP